jgi:hypothetical protein
MEEIVKEIDARNEASIEAFLAGGEKRLPSKEEKLSIQCSHSQKDLSSVTTRIRDDGIAATKFLSAMHQAPFKTDGETTVGGFKVTMVHFSDQKMEIKDKMAAFKQFITHQMLRNNQARKKEDTYRYSENPVLKGKSLAITMTSSGCNVQLLLLKKALSLGAQIGQKILALLRKCLFSSGKSLLTLGNSQPLPPQNHMFI